MRNVCAEGLRALGPGMKTPKRKKKKKDAETQISGFI